MYYVHFDILADHAAFGQNCATASFYRDLRFAEVDEMVKGRFARTMPKAVVLIAPLLLLAGCGAAAGSWAKPGADAAATASAYRDCRAVTDTATRTDADIDQDIGASRASDLQHSSIAREGSQEVHDQNADRADAILASCMQAKGFTRSR
jgi:hypothetical protein